MSESMLYETHMHTPLCRHAEGEVGSYAAVAEQRGLTGVIVTCHNPLPDGFSGDVRMAEDEMPLYLRLVADAREAWRGRMDVRLGMECDYYPRFEDYLRRQTAAADFDYLLGSVHAHLRVWRDAFEPTSPDALVELYCQQLRCVAECGLFDAVAHPELLLSKKCLPADYEPRRFLDALDRTLSAVAATGVAMELNTSAGLASERGRGYMPDLLRLYRQHGLAVVIGSDAHTPRRVAEGWPLALRILAEAGFEHVSLVLERRRCKVPLADAAASLAAGEAAHLDFRA